jgi:hypothetical protein
MSRGSNNKSRSRGAIRARALPTTTPRKDSPPAKEGGGAPKGASNQFPRSTDKRCRLPMPGRGGATRRQVYAVCALICLRGALAFRRYTAALARTFTSWLSSRPCLLGSVRAGILPALSGSQSSGSTPRLGRSTEGNDARSRSGAGCEPARKHRTRSTLQIASGMRPSMSEIRWLVADLVTRVKKIVSDRATAKTGGRVKRSQRLV